MQQISVSDAICSAWAHTKRVLFAFDFCRGLTLGFVSFLASLGEGGGSSFNVPDLGGRGGGGSGGPNPALDWIRDNLDLLITIGIVVVVVGIALGIALLWVSSRGKLMFVDCVVKDRAAVKEPWARFAELGKRLFVFRLWLSLIGLVAIALGGGVGVLIAWSDVSSGTFGTAALTGILVGVGLILLASLPLLVVGAVLEYFIVPTMVRFDESVRPAWERVKSGVFRGHGGEIVVYYLMKIALGFAVGIIAAVLTCITCCIIALPYVGSVALLPLSVFLRSYSIFFLQQFGPDWQMVEPPEPAPYPY